MRYCDGPVGLGGGFVALGCCVHRGRLLRSAGLGIEVIEYEDEDFIEVKDGKWKKNIQAALAQLIQFFRQLRIYVVC
jgi:hypothetical protein